MTTSSYHLKIRGRTLGPFSADRLRQMVREGSLSRIHQISIDGENWQSASEFPQLFLVGEKPNSTDSNKSATVEIKTSSSSAPLRVEAESHNSNLDTFPAHFQFDEIPDTVWYYGINDQSTGPVSHSMITELIKAGQLSPSDKLWRSGMDDWETVQDVKEFAQVVPIPNARGKRQRDNLRSTPQVGLATTIETGEISSQWISKLIMSSIAWVYVCFILLYCVAALGALGSILSIIQGIQSSNILEVVIAMMGFVLSVLLGVAGFQLNMYANRVGRYAITGTLDDLYIGFKYLNWFWTIVGSLAILWVLTVVFFLFATYTMRGSF